MHTDLRSTAAGALLGTFAGDAAGAPWEGAATARGRSGATRVRDSLAAGTLRYTDDTQLTLALAEHLCAAPHVETDGLIATILRHYEPGRGYGAGMRALVRAWQRGMPAAEAATSVFEDGSYGNGAAMRAAPVGVLWARAPHTLADVAARQARVTHVHRLGVAGAVVQAHAVGLAARRQRFGPPELDEVADLPGAGPLRSAVTAAAQLARGWAADPSLTLAAVAGRLGNEVVAHRSVPAALWAAAAGGGFVGSVELAVGLGGDADTLAAMAGAVRGAADGAAAVAWQQRLEDGHRGRSYALDLAGRLARTAAGPITGTDRPPPAGGDRPEPR